MRTLTSLLGVLAALVLLGVSGAMNYLFLSSLGKTPIEGYVLGAASAAADVLKALLPFFIAWSWRAGRYAVAVPGVIVWVFFAGFSLLSAIGFAADNRQDFSHTRESLNAAYEIARTDLAAAEAKQAILPKHRPEAVVSEEIKGHKQDYRWTSTKSCTDATLPESRAYCERYFTLRAELAAGIEADRIARKIDNLKGEIIRLESDGAGQDADPQVSLLARLFGHGEDRIRLSLIVIVAILVEIGSSLGLFLATSHGALFARREISEAVEHGGSLRKRSVEPVPETIDTIERMPTGDVVDFCLERLWPTPDGSLTLKELFEGYQRWCDETGCEALRRKEFDFSFKKVAGQVGLTSELGRYEGLAIRADAIGHTP